jgi:hypothetical protein
MHSSAAGGKANPRNVIFVLIVPSGELPPQFVFHVLALIASISISHKSLKEVRKVSHSRMSLSAVTMLRCGDACSVLQAPEVFVIFRGHTPFSGISSDSTWT